MRRSPSLALLLAGALSLGACSGVGGAPADRSTTTSTCEETAMPHHPAQRDDEALRAAARTDDVRAACGLIAAGSDVNAKDSGHESAYLLAASENAPGVLDLTLEHGATVNDKDSWNGTALIRAAERGHALVVGKLLRAGIDKDHVNRIGYQAIHEVVWLGADDRSHLDTTRVLVAGGVQLERPSGREGLTPLQMARERGHDAIEATLRLATSDARLGDPDEALRAAVTTGDADRAAVAIRQGADVESRDEQGRTPLLLAATHDQVSVARLLVAMGADPDALDDQHDTPWLVTGVTGSVAMADALLPAGPNLREVNRYGGTSLIPASERGHVDYVRRVVRTDLDVDHVNDLGWTALLEAVVLGDGGADHQQIVRILLRAGADASIADDDGVTPKEHAERRGQSAVVRILSTSKGSSDGS